MYVFARLIGCLLLEYIRGYIEYISILTYRYSMMIIILIIDDPVRSPIYIYTFAHMNLHMQFDQVAFCANYN